MRPFPPLEQAPRRDWRRILRRTITVLLVIAALAVVVPRGISYLLLLREGTDRATCSKNIRTIGTALDLYAQANGGTYPARLEDLILTLNITPDVFICPASNDDKATGKTPQEVAANMAAPGHLSYLYAGKGLTSAVEPKTILIYEPLSNHAMTGIHVVYASGEMVFVEADAAKHVLSELSLGHNPPRTPP